VATTIVLILLSSPDAVLRNGKPDQDVVQALIKAKQAGNPVGLISIHEKPAWFDATFGTSGVQFVQDKGRQKGEIVRTNAKSLGLQPFDVLVLASKEADLSMGKNGGAVLVAAGWSPDERVRSLGIGVDNANQLTEVISLTSAWNGKWWFEGDSESYKVRALADLSGYGQALPQQVFAQKLTDTAKGGGPRLNALLAIVARSLLMDGNPGQIWGVYPSSKSTNDDKEILSNFTHRLRTTVSRVRFAEKGQPLFIRHKHSVKRSSTGGATDRTDPTDQLLTLQINPHYKGRIHGKHAVIIDDCATYGVSFGVAAALLLQAGVTGMTGIALGKFGSQLRRYEILVTGDPYAPLKPSDFKVVNVEYFEGTTNKDSQNALLALIP